MTVTADHAMQSEEMPRIDKQLAAGGFSCKPVGGGEVLLAPGAAVTAGLISDTVESVEHGHVGRQSLLSDHVPHQHHKVVIWQAVCALPQLC